MLNASKKSSCKLKCLQSNLIPCNATDVKRRVESKRVHCQKKIADFMLFFPFTRGQCTQLALSVSLKVAKIGDRLQQKKEIFD